MTRGKGFRPYFAGDSVAIQRPVTSSFQVPQDEKPVSLTQLPLLHREEEFFYDELPPHRFGHESFQLSIVCEVRRSADERCAALPESLLRVRCGEPVGHQ